MINNPGSVTISRKWLLIGGVALVVVVAIIWYIRNNGPQSQNAAPSGVSGNGVTDSLNPIDITLSRSGPGPMGTPGSSFGHSGHISTNAGSGLATTQYPGGADVPFGGTRYTEQNGQQLYQIAQQEYGNLSGDQLQTAVRGIINANQFPGGLTQDDSLTTVPSQGASIIIPQIPYSSLYGNTGGAQQ